MALDRQSIEKKDFPIGRRGYEPQAVDAHLNRIAEEIEELKSSTRRRSESLAGSASDQVRAIVEAAEQTASGIQRDAEQEAQDIRREARSEVKSVREEASSQASEYVAKVSAATSAMLDRLGAIEQELSSMTDSLRTGATRVDSDLKLLESNLAEVTGAVSPGAELEPEAAEPVGTPPAPAQVPEPEEVYEDAAPAPEEPDADAAEPEPQAGEAPTQAGDDLEGARLIALNMALNGTPRDEVDRYLQENFDLADRAALVEEVYASVEG